MWSYSHDATLISGAGRGLRVTEACSVQQIHAPIAVSGSWDCDVYCPSGLIAVAWSEGSASGRLSAAAAATYSQCGAVSARESKWIMSERRRAAVMEERLQRLVKRCGEAVHLVPDTLMVTENIANHYPPSWQAYITRQELAASIRGLRVEPLMTALQGGQTVAAAVECRHCQPKEPLMVMYRNLSGSSAECLYDLVVGRGGKSDYDVMLEFGGPFRWAAAAGPEATTCISPEEAPQLWAEPTNNPGFVTLHWARTSRCSHEAPLAALPADSLRRLIWYHCRMLSHGGEITCSGPAVNVKKSGATNDGTDAVPCFRMPWWPEGEAFLCCYRETDFPPAETRLDICRFGVHLVPTGCPGSDTEQSEYRISFSRAEVVTVRHLSPVQHETIRSTKRMKNALKDIGAAPSLRSYYIKTAVLWLVQDQSSDRWTGVTRGVNMVLDWLEHHLSAGNVPCFFWAAINLVAGRSTAEMEDMINTVKLMRRKAATLLIACCEKLGYNLDFMLKGGSEPLSQNQLRLRLARQLVLSVVGNGIMYRSTAPCWEHWMRSYLPALSHLSQHQLLQLQQRHVTVTYRQQCYLLQALVVAPADLVTGMQLMSLGDDMFTWPVAPLLSLLTESDMRFLLGNPAAVANWCHRQMCRPPAERPAGLTAELDTPRGRAELLLQPELLLRAVNEAVPSRRAAWQILDRMEEAKWGASIKPLDTYQQCRETLEKHLFHANLENWLRHALPELDGPTVAATARLWRRRLEHLLSGDRLREAYTTVTTRWPDRWRLQQYLVLGSPAEGKTSRRRGASRLAQVHTYTCQMHYRVLPAEMGHVSR